VPSASPSGAQKAWFCARASSGAIFADKRGGFVLGKPATLLE
jgi:hypothetical protein